MVEGFRKRSPSELMNESLSSNPNNRSQASFGPSGKGQFEFRASQTESSLNKSNDIRSSMSKGEEKNIGRNNEQNFLKTTPRFGPGMKV